MDANAHRRLSQTVTQQLKANDEEWEHRLQRQVEHQLMPRLERNVRENLIQHARPATARSGSGKELTLSEQRMEAFRDYVNKRIEDWLQVIPERYVDSLRGRLTKMPELAPVLLDDCLANPPSLAQNSLPQELTRHVILDRPPFMMAIGGLGGLGMLFGISRMTGINFDQALAGSPLLKSVLTGVLAIVVVGALVWKFVQRNRKSAEKARRELEQTIIRELRKLLEAQAKRCRQGLRDFSEQVRLELQAGIETAQAERRRSTSPGTKPARPHQPNY